MAKKPYTFYMEEDHLRLLEVISSVSRGKPPVSSLIREAMAAGWLKIDPFDEDSLQPATYDLGVGDIAVVSTSPKPVDLRQNPLLTIEPFAAALLQTQEILWLSPMIVGRLGPRSNLLRQ